MSSKLNKSAYQQLIDEDIAELHKMPRTLERDHAIDVLRQSVENYYPDQPALVELGRRWQQDSSLEKWFPYTYEEIQELKRKVTALQNKILDMRSEMPPELLEKTFCIEYSPNCVNEWLVRLAGKSCVIDKRQYAYKEGCTGDALGFGKTLHEAFGKALKEQQRIKNEN